MVFPSSAFFRSDHLSIPRAMQRAPPHSLLIVVSLLLGVLDYADPVGLGSRYSSRGVPSPLALLL